MGCDHLTFTGRGIPIVTLGTNHYKRTMTVLNEDPAITSTPKVTSIPLHLDVGTDDLHYNKTVLRLMFTTRRYNGA
jgi:hypothetical protein